MEIAMNMKHAVRCATAVSFALFVSAPFAADNTTTSDQPMTGKQKATAIGAGTGAVAGAVVGGPVGAVVGGVAGAVVGHEGTDANGKVTNTGSSKSNASMAAPDGTVRAAQAALEAQGYSPGSIDGQFGPNTQSALRKFQADKGLAQTGSLDSATKTALGI